MTGIIEEMQKSLATISNDQTIMCNLLSEIAAKMRGEATPTPTPAAIDPFAGLGGAKAEPTPSNVTGEMVTALIIKAVEDPAVKEALGAEMRAMGINALPEAQPHQFAELYTRFQAVIAKAGGNSAASIV